MNFWFHELCHIFLTLAIVLIFYRQKKNWRTLFLIIFLGIFIDIDHLLDYFAYFGANFNLHNFLNVAAYMLPAGKIYVLLHGWEYLLPLYWLKNKITAGPYIAYLIHLVIDSLNVGVPIAYSLIYRLVNNFQISVFNG